MKTESIESSNIYKVHKNRYDDWAKSDKKMYDFFHRNIVPKNEVTIKKADKVLEKLLDIALSENEINKNEYKDLLQILQDKKNNKNPLKIRFTDFLKAFEIKYDIIDLTPESAFSFLILPFINIENMKNLSKLKFNDIKFIEKDSGIYMKYSVDGKSNVLALLGEPGKLYKKVFEKLTEKFGTEGHLFKFTKSESHNLFRMGEFLYNDLYKYMEENPIKAYVTPQRCYVFVKEAVKNSSPDVLYFSDI